MRFSEKNTSGRYVVWIRINWSGSMKVVSTGACIEPMHAQDVE